MPPRFAYWTILVDDRPTAFRAAEKEELLPTVRQLQRTNKNVALKWHARGRLWESREAAVASLEKIRDGHGQKRRPDRPPGSPTRPRGGVSHLVLLKPRSDLSRADREKLVAAFEPATREIPTVRRVRVGQRFTHGAGYEKDMPDTADYLVIIDFDNREGLAAYLRHPAHVELGTRFNESLAAALVYDF